MRQFPGARAGTAQPSAAQRELTALQMQRDELRSQLRQLGSRRNQLDEQRQVTGDANAKASLQARMAEIDQRTARVDAQIAALDDRISNAIARTASAGEAAVAEPTVPQPPQPAQPPQGPQFPPFPDFSAFPGQRPEYLSITPQQLAGALITEAVVFVLLGVVFWRVGWKRMREQLDRIAGSQSAQVERVQQAVDVIAVEVERISENQRFVSKVLSAGAAEPIGREEKAEIPVRRGER